MSELNNEAYNIIVITGPTATGKTAFATHLAAAIDGEIISADSRQIYRGMDLGTGKDIDEYVVDGRPIPYHLIDIKPAGYKYNLYEYCCDFYAAYEDIVGRGKMPILCGGTGLYVESVLKGYRMVEVPVNEPLRASLEGKSIDELKSILEQYKTLHNVTDIETTKRAIRAIEIADYYKSHSEEEDKQQRPELRPLVLGVSIDVETRRRSITRRLKQRLENGMIDEVRQLLETVPAEDLLYYGLEYKFLTLFLTGKLTYEEMFSQLEIAIHQFAKRQMTWFRGMERRGIPIQWVDYQIPLEEKVEVVKKMMKK
ncbi:MAG: tRNA (adenosine(37)-N6)-dimethylallyltransferase MiaA [Paludibacteraceae bacterium]|nr:tRNA (adenosine(37)-N6)-dimethylallyltransferase MiaA [Paludibacteraceae bacterium]